jgi:hypothetical protein
MPLAVAQIAQHGLRATPGINIGRVDEVHTMGMGMGIAHDGSGLGVSGLVAKHHGAQAQGGNLQIAVAKIVVLKGRLRAPDLLSDRGGHDHYLARRRIATKPAIASSPESMIIAHSESVGIALVSGGTGARPGTTKPWAVPPEHALTVLPASVTVPFRARALPCKVALVSRVILVSARMFPWTALKVPIAAELATVHQTSHGVAPLMRLTLDAPGPLAVTSELVWIT